MLGALRQCLATLAIFAASCSLAIGCTTGTEASAASSPPMTTQPAAEAPASTTEPPRLTRYSVVRGDTLIRIAERHGIHLNDLVRANNIADPTVIYVGQILMIPPPPDAAAGPALTVAPATDPILPPLLPTTSAPPITLPRSP